MNIFPKHTASRITCRKCGNVTDEAYNYQPCPACGSNYLHIIKAGEPKWVSSTTYFWPYLEDISPSLCRLFKSYRQKVRKAPGSTILCIADFLYSPATVEKIFKQEVADWRLEYFEALKSDRHWKARWISCRHYWAIAKAVSLDRLVSFFDGVLRRI
jgi:ribosomal protein L37E